MPNPHRGEVPLTVGDRILILRCGNNALAELEEAIGLPIHQLWQRWTDGSVGVRELRAMLWAFARGSNKRWTLEDAGDVLDEVGTEAVSRALLQAVKLAFPTNAADNGGGPRETAGVGSNS